MKCDICLWTNDVLKYEMGGLRPRESFQLPQINLCPSCRQSMQRLIAKGRLVFRTGERDTTNSRFSKIKAAVKRDRFGDANISAAKIPRESPPEKRRYLCDSALEEYWYYNETKGSPKHCATIIFV